MEVPLVRPPAPLTAWICAVLAPLCPIAITAARGEESPSLRLEAKIPLGQVSGRIDHRSGSSAGASVRGGARKRERERDRSASKEGTAKAEGLSRTAGRRLCGHDGHPLRRERRGRVA